MTAATSPINVGQLVFQLEFGGVKRLSSPAVLLVEDDRILREVMLEILSAEGFAVSTSDDSVDALRQLLAGAKYDVVVLDHEMPRLKGLDLLSILRSEKRWVPCVLYSGSLELAAAQCKSLRVGPVLHKPCEISVLVRAINDAIDSHA